MQISIKELLNCYENSSLISVPLKLVGKPYWHEVDRKVDEGFQVDTRKKTNLKKKKKKLNRVKLIKSMTTAKNITSSPTSQVIDGRMVNMTTESLMITETLPTNDSHYYRLQGGVDNFPNDRSMEGKSGYNRISDADEPQMEWSATSYVLITITLIAALAFVAFGLMCFTRLREFTFLNLMNALFYVLCLLFREFCSAR